MENKENNEKNLVWSDEMDEILLKEAILYEPYQFKCRTKESGNAWKAISESLISCHPPPLVHHKYLFASLQGEVYIIENEEGKRVKT